MAASYDEVLNNQIIEINNFYNEDLEKLKNNMRTNKLTNDMISFIEFRRNRVKIYTKDNQTIELEAIVDMRFTNFPRKVMNYDVIKNLNIYEFIEIVRRFIANAVVYELSKGNITEDHIIYKKARV